VGTCHLHRFHQLAQLVGIYAAEEIEPFVAELCERLRVSLEVNGAQPCCDLVVGRLASAAHKLLALPA
jgi:hypothetical protein